MIPKIIHYCWFGRGEMPKLAINCIKSWHKYLPDYEYKLWNEDSSKNHIMNHFAGSWAEKSNKQKIKEFITKKIIGPKLTDKLVNLKRKIFK